MIPVKSERDLRIMRQSCAIAATVLDRLCQLAQEGVSTWDLDQAAKKLMAEHSCRSACYNYKNGRLRFPSYADIVSFDISTVYQGFVGDNTRTVLIGNVAPEVQNLVSATDQALRAGIAQARAGNRVGDISAAIQKHIEAHGYGIVREFTGHGVGRSLHEEPQIPNYGKAGTGPVLKPGMTLAIEPMVNMGVEDIFVGDDGWTVYTADGKPSCHIEHTVLVTHDEPEILTLPIKE